MCLFIWINVALNGRDASEECHEEKRSKWEMSSNGWQSAEKDRVDFCHHNEHANEKILLPFVHLCVSIDVRWMLIATYSLIPWVIFSWWGLLFLIFSCSPRLSAVNRPCCCLLSFADAYSSVYAALYSAIPAIYTSSKLNLENESKSLVDVFTYRSAFIQRDQLSLLIGVDS